MENLGALSVLRSITESAFASFPHPVGTSPVHWKGAFTRRCVERLAVALAHANSFIVEEATVKAGDSSAETAKIYRGLRKLVR